MTSTFTKTNDNNNKTSNSSTNNNNSSNNNKNRNTNNINRNKNNNHNNNNKTFTRITTTTTIATTTHIIAGLTSTPSSSSSHRRQKQCKSVQMKRILQQRMTNIINRRRSSWRSRTPARRKRRPIFTRLRDAAAGHRGVAGEQPPWGAPLRLVGRRQRHHESGSCKAGPDFTRAEAAGEY